MPDKSAPYGANHVMMPSTRLLLERVRAEMDRRSEEEDGRLCPLTNDEIICVALGQWLAQRNKDGYVTASDLSRRGEKEGY